MIAPSGHLYFASSSFPPEEGAKEAEVEEEEAATTAEDISVEQIIKGKCNLEFMQCCIVQSFKFNVAFNVAFSQSKISFLPKDFLFAQRFPFCPKISFLPKDFLFAQRFPFCPKISFLPKDFLFAQTVRRILNFIWYFIR